MTFKLEMPGVKYGEVISQKYTCDGTDKSPALKWEDAPQSAKSFILIVEDPDAPKGTFIHWVIYNIKPEVKELPENVPKEDVTPQGWAQGINDFGKIGYNGPCPPGKQVHRYFFTLYGVLQPPDLKPGLSKKDMDRILEVKTVKKVSFMVKFGRAYEHS